MIKRAVLLTSILVVLAFAPHAAAQIEAEMFDGRPAFAEGEDAGYHVWREGDTWHVRWTTRGNLRRFSGSVEAEGGDLKSLKRIDVESEKVIVRRGSGPRVAVGPRGRAHVRRGRGPVVATREQDKIEKDGDKTIVFLSRTDDDIDGFNFKVGDKVTSLRFVLEIDGKRFPKRVEVGEDSRAVSELPFVVQLD